MSRLVAFVFRVFTRDGAEQTSAVFYASSPDVATKYATEWAARFGYRVRLVRDEAAA